MTKVKRLCKCDRIIKNPKERYCPKCKKNEEGLGPRRVKSVRQQKISFRVRGRE